MKQDRQAIIAAALRLVREMPPDMVESLLRCVEEVSPSESAAAKERILRCIPQPHHRNLAGKLLQSWQAVPELTPAEMSLILSVAAASEKTHRGSQSIELVWTGPDSTVIPIRLTEQALLELIKSATKQLLMVSYAVYKIPRICEALVGAAERDVSIRIIIEEPDRHQGETAYRNIDALGEAVAARSAIFLWPSEKREKDIGGKPGILHVKCAVADAHMLLLSSANLTEYAFTVNMELGLLVTGGNLPEQIVRLFDRMIEAKVLVGLQLSRD